MGVLTERPLVGLTVSVAIHTAVLAGVATPRPRAAEPLPALVVNLGAEPSEPRADADRVDTTRDRGTDGAPPRRRRARSGDAAHVRTAPGVGIPKSPARPPHLVSPAPDNPATAMPPRPDQPPRFEAAPELSVATPSREAKVAAAPAHLDGAPAPDRAPVGAVVSTESGRVAEDAVSAPAVAPPASLAAGQGKVWAETPGGTAADSGRATATPRSGAGTVGDSGASATSARLARGGPGSDGVGEAGDYSPYYRRLRQLIVKALIYPAAARQRGLEGVVRLELVIEPSGSFSSVTVLQSSTEWVLDDAAIRTVRALRPPPLPPGLPPRTLVIVVPLVFELH
jgi:protein TonB